MIQTQIQATQIQVEPANGNNGNNNNSGDPFNTSLTTPVGKEQGATAQENQNINDLLKIVSVQKIELELNRLKNSMGFSTQEDGKRFIYVGSDINDTSTYTDIKFNQQSPTNQESDALSFPPLQNNTLVGAHYHPPLDDSSPPKPIRKVPSGTDIAEHIVMVKKIAETNPTTSTQTNQVTNFIVSKGASGKTYAIRTNDEQSIVDLDGDFEIGGEKRTKIATDLAQIILPILVSDIDAQEEAIALYLAENYPSLSIYVAVYNSEGNIVTWTKL